MKKANNIFSRVKAAKAFLPVLACCVFLIAGTSVKAQSFGDDTGMTPIPTGSSQSSNQIAHDAGYAVGKVYGAGFDLVEKGTGAVADFGGDIVSNSWQAVTTSDINHPIEFVGGVLGTAVGGGIYLVGEGTKLVSKGARITTTLTLHAGGAVMDFAGDMASNDAALLRGLSAISEKTLGFKIVPFEWMAKAFDKASTGLHDAGTALHSTANALSGKQSNKECNLAQKQKDYMSNCYSCMIVKTLIETFMEAGARTYELTKQAGNIVLVIGAVLTLALMMLRNVSSFANIEPAEQMNSILIFLFKVLLAFAFINAGLDVLVHYAFDPILAAGSDFGLAIIKASGNDVTLSNSNQWGRVPYTYGGAAIISASVINKMLALNQALDALTSTNLVAGHALMCHATHAGTLDFAGGTVQTGIPNVWIWFCGLAIWFFGFMLTFGISFYLLDVCFKIGFAIMFLPIAIALWPFSLTKDKLGKIFSIILNAGGVFMFLAVVTALAMALISQSYNGLATVDDKTGVKLSGIDNLVQQINNDNTLWVAETFKLTGSYFIIILFCYLYALKLVATSIKDYAGKFFGDDVFSGAAPMHGKLTQATGMVKNAVGAGASLGKDIAVTQGSKAAGKLANKFVGGKKSGGGSGMNSKGGSGGFNVADKGTDKATDKLMGGGKKKKEDENSGPISDKEDMEKNDKKTVSSSTVKNSGKAVEGGGKAMEAGGKAVEAGGKAMDASGKAVETGGKAVEAGGAGIQSAGKAISAIPIPVVAQVVGGAISAAGTGVKAAGKGVQAAGKAVQKAGKAVQKAGKGVQKAGKNVKKAGEEIKKTGDTMEKAGGGKLEEDSGNGQQGLTGQKGGKTINLAEKTDIGTLDKDKK